MTRRDPIVEEVRKHREAIAREHGNDLEAIVAALEGDQSSGDGPTVSFPPKRIAKGTLRALRGSGRNVEGAANRGSGVSSADGGAGVRPRRR